MNQQRQRVVWAEGLFLGQQHFQQWDRNLQREIHQRTDLARPHGWGLVSLNLVEDALAVGQCRIESLSAILPNGQWVQYDGQRDGAPLLCDLEAGGDSVTVWLAQPDNERVNGISGYQEQGRLCGWRADYLNMPDEHDPARTREVIIGKPNLVLLRGDESREHYSAIRLGKFETIGDGAWQRADEVIAPLVNLQASEALLGTVNRIRDLIAARVRQLSQQRNSYGELADMGSRELAQVLRLQQLRPALTLLDHQLREDGTHPEAVYLTLVQLTAGLWDLQPDMDELAVPEYIHSELADVFAGLEVRLRAALLQESTVTSTALSLRQESPALLIAEGIPWQGIHERHLYLGIYHEADNPEWIMEFGRQCKAGSREDLELILASALPGIRLSHTQRPPNKLPVKSGFEYFRVEPAGEFWPRAVEAESLAVFLPAQFQGCRFELLCIED